MTSRTSGCSRTRSAISSSEPGRTSARKPWLHGDQPQWARLRGEEQPLRLTDGYAQKAENGDAAWAKEQAPARRTGEPSMRSISACAACSA